MEELVALHAPSLLSLMNVLKLDINMSLPTLQCPREWSRLISALACRSPVCALLHPSDKLFNLLRKIADDDFTSNPLNMETLQQEVPIFFEVLRNVTHLPKKAIIELISALIDKAEAPFHSVRDYSTQTITADTELLQELSYFPHLLPTRTRGVYEADKHLRKAAGCTKRSSGHPYCQGFSPYFVHMVSDIIYLLQFVV